MSNSNSTSVMIDKYEYDLIEHSYFGTGGFKNGLYIIPTPSESPSKYIYRSQIASYNNYVKQIVDANYLPVGNGIDRDFLDNIILSAFAKNCDGNGNSFEKFMKSTRLETLLYGCTINFIDMPSDVKPNRKEHIDSGNYGRLVRVNPRQISYYELYGEGNLKYLSYVSGEVDGVPLYTIYDEGYFYKSTSGISKDSFDKIQGNKVEAVHKPIIFSFEPYYNPWRLPKSRFSDLAGLAVSLYDEESKIKYQTASTTFNLFVMPDTSFKSEEGMEINENTGVKINPATSGGLMPSFISPQNTIVEIQGVVNEIIKSMYETTNMNVLSTSADASGSSRAYSDLIRIENLENVAESSQEFEYSIINELLIANQIKVDFTISYPSDFASLTINEQIEAGQKLIDTLFGDKNKQKVSVDLLNKYFVGSTKEEKAEYIANEEAGGVYTEELFK